MESLDKSDQLSRALGPEKFKDVADARRAMWTGGGGGFLLAGAAAFAVLTAFPPAVAAAANVPAHVRRMRQGSLKSALVLMAASGGAYLGSMFSGTPALQKSTETWTSSER